MKAKRIFLMAVAAASVVAAGVVSSAFHAWFEQSFSALPDGTAFTGTSGATGGTWSDIPAGVATVATVGGRKCIRINTMDTERGDIGFQADTVPGRTVRRFDFQISANPVVRPPTLQETDRGGLCLVSTNQVGVREFAGYANGKWNTLYGHGFAQRECEWLDCRADFEYLTNSVGTVVNAFVTYYANCGGSYAPLTDAAGTSRFAVSTDGVQEIAFQGVGSVGEFSGLVRDAASSMTWVGEDTGDWDEAKNWSPEKVPGDGDIAIVGDGKEIVRNVGGVEYRLLTYGTQQKISHDYDDCLRVMSGEVEVRGEFPGKIVIESGATLFAGGVTTNTIELAYGSTLNLEEALTVVGAPIFLDGVNLKVFDYNPSAEAEAVLTAPYGSGGIPASLQDDVGEALEGRSAVWRGRLDGSSTLWLVNEDYVGKTAVWKNGAWGRLDLGENWEDVKPSKDNAAWMGEGRAHLNDGATFEFARRFEIGADTNKNGEVSMSGGAISGAAIIVGTKGGSGLLDLVKGTVLPADYLWDYALTVGADTNATGVVKVGVESTTENRVRIADGGISIGAGGAATMEIGAGKNMRGCVEANGPVAVGYDGALFVTGGLLVGRDAFYIGRTTREETYDVNMAVSGGAVSNLSENGGAFWVGSYGGIGSKATLTITGGEVFSTNRFVCGGYRSAAVEVAGGSLIAPEICVGHALIDENDVASFSMTAGRIETAGFTGGTGGERSVTLAGGEIAATSTNDDFFAGIDLVRLDGGVALDNESNITIRAALMGPGGLVKTGVGTNAVAGYAAWAGKTIVEEGVLDMRGGMIMGELEVADGAAVVNAKYDNIDALLFTSKPWENGETSVGSYLRIEFKISADAASAAVVTNGEGVVKGAFGFADADGLAFSGWTALGWTSLYFADGMPVEAGQEYDVCMMFDFSDGKQYVLYYAKRDSAWERLVSEDGLTVFPVAGVAANATGFSGQGVTTGEPLGEQLEVDADHVYYWKGPDKGMWNDAANWLDGSGASSGCPSGEDVAFVEKPVTIVVSGDCSVGSLVVNSDVSLTNGSLAVGNRIAGIGALTLLNAGILGQGESVSVGVPIEIGAGANSVGGTGAQLHGALRGAGDVSVSALIYGDTSAFSGHLELLDGCICADAAAHNALSSWTVNGSVFPFAVDGIPYEFGALKGSLTPDADDPKNIELDIGMRNAEDSSLDGGWDVPSGFALNWMASNNTLAYSVTNTAYLGLRGGGKVSLGMSEGLPAKVSFVEKGGELSFATGADADVSSVFGDSTMPIVFNDTGVSRTWANAIDSSNVGGFVKRGAGTLTWLKAPGFAMDVTIEAGTLVVPFGTRLGHVVIAEGARIVVDASAAQAGAVAFAAASANRKLSQTYLQFENLPPSFELNRIYGDNNSIVVANASSTYLWTGNAGDNKWSTLENWSVGGAVPDRVPTTNDVVEFSGVSCTTVRLDVAAYVLKAVCSRGALHLVGGKLSTVLSVEVSQNDLELEDGVTVDCGSDMTVRSVSGSGSISTGSKTLTVSPQLDTLDEFAGTLNVTNLVKAGKGTFRYVPKAKFDGEIHIGRGTLQWDCADDMANQPMAWVTMTAGSDPDTVLDLCEKAVTVGSFTGSGVVQNGILITEDGIVTQSGGRLVIPMTEHTTYYASRSDEPLELTVAEGTDEGMSVKIVVGRTWFAAGASGRRAIYCRSTNIDWGTTKAISEGDGWWSIAGGGFAVRLR